MLEPIASLRLHQFYLLAAATELSFVYVGNVARGCLEDHVANNLRSIWYSISDKILRNCHFSLSFSHTNTQ
jgi:hypothetical protein